MGSNSLDSGAHLAQAVNSYDANPDLDDALVYQALSAYQANRERLSGMTNCFPSSSLNDQPLQTRTSIKDGHLEIIVDLPGHRNGPFDEGPIWKDPGFFPRNTDTRDRTRIWDDPGFCPDKPYACASFHKPRPIDEKIVACSSRIRVEEVPIFGCSKQLKIEIDLPDFYLCSSNIRIKPDWTNDEGPSHDYGCVFRPGMRPKGSDFYACAQMLPIDGTYPRPEVTLCVSKIGPYPRDISKINACAAKISPLEPAERDDVFACVDRWTPRVKVENPQDQMIGCGQKVPGEPGFYRLCSATQPKQYIPEFLENERRHIAELEQEFNNGTITQGQYEEGIKSWSK